MHTNPTRSKRVLLVLLVIVILVAGGLLGLASIMRKPARPPAPVAEVLSGEQIYQKHCASCHGAKGEGGKEYPEPLMARTSPSRSTRSAGAEVSSPQNPAITRSSWRPGTVHDSG